MPKRSSTASPEAPTKKRGSSDPNVAAFNMLQEIIEKSENEGKDPLAVALGRRGGLKGGRARADKLTAEQRRDSASNAAKARWARDTK